MEGELPVSALSSNKPDEGYVILQGENRPTLKQMMQKEFAAGNVSGINNDQNGSWIEFQGPLLEVARQSYEKLPNVAKLVTFSDGVGGSNVGCGEVTSKQHRGLQLENWIPVSKISDDANDSHSRWIGFSDKDTKRELTASRTTFDMVPNNEAVANRIQGKLKLPSNMDLKEMDDEWLWTHGTQVQTQDLVNG